MRLCASFGTFSLLFTMFPRIVALICAATAISARAAVITRQSEQRPLQTIFQFPDQHWIENQAVRRNGDLLANDLGQYRTYLVDPTQLGVEPKTLYQFPQGTILTGIAEVEEDVFYVSAQQGYIYTFSIQPNASTIYKIDLRSYARTHKPLVSKLVDIPSAQFLNGMTLLNRRDGTLLLSDSQQGVIYRLNTRTREYEIVVDDPYLKGPSAFPGFGVNGIRVSGNQLYIANVGFGRIARAPVSLRTGRLTGPITIISDQVSNADDFAVDERDGSVFLARNTARTLSRVFLDGRVETVAGSPNSTELIGPVAAVLGRGKSKGKLIVSTDGVTTDASGVPLTTAGKIVSLDVRDCL
ncbi:hypothetical protein BDZ85DRAFT_261627 [Elsinoe ampelina]|uniref:SMP-30/Gluconolactonase/LRE-like region domain-containing protein n=1 Tax=Elsinoe ampelina TaxID=302913 RepID=A0A6A6GD51_9PEZI|nr:hypothetical protein BDZ85DRAFT_261627 [Elsinoe ampelina]